MDPNPSTDSASMLQLQPSSSKLSRPSSIRLPYDFSTTLPYYFPSSYLMEGDQPAVDLNFGALQLNFEKEDWQQGYVIEDTVRSTWPMYNGKAIWYQSDPKSILTRCVNHDVF